MYVNKPIISKLAMQILLYQDGILLNFQGQKVSITVIEGIN